ncbi:hypothetical protein ACWFMI_24780 [Nocardiopsis terrae]|uniref:hypothetical protein n=1 Tax=Streptomyces sp. NPDC057554 TaxID=3350538 RepID=UPI0036CF5424
MATFQPGDRIHTTVDAPPAWEGAWGAPVGTLGTITNHYPPKHSPRHGYGVLLDGDPDQLPAYYDANELATA